MEELVQALVEQGVVERSPSGEGRLRPARKVDFAALRVPPTVQAVLAARIDRLAPAEKTLLQLLAVIGKEFSFSLLKHVAHQPEAVLQRSLAHLQAAEFVYEQPAFPEVEYTFKHALTQDVAYNSVLLEQRKGLHERTAQAVEALFDSQLEDHYGDLAHHYSRSGNTEKAVEYLGLAGRQAAQRSANTDAIRHLTTALELLQTLPATAQRAQHELTLLIVLGSPLRVSKGFAAPEVERVYARAQELCEQRGDIAQRFSALRGLWGIYFARGQPRLTREVAAQLLQVAEDAHDATLLLEAHHVMGMAAFFFGELPAARAHLEQGLALYDPQHQPSLAFLYPYVPGADCRSWLSDVLWCLGYPDQARQRSQEALALAYELPDHFTLAGGLSHATRLYRLRGELPLTQQYADTLRALATEQGFPLFAAQGAILQGWILAEQGQTEAGLAKIRQGLAALRDMGIESTRPYNLALLAEAYGKAGQREEGLTTLAEALAIEDKTGERRDAAELYRLKGELTLQIQVQGPRSKVEEEAAACFLKAIEVARKQCAKSLELRAVMSLSRLWQTQGKHHEAHQLLAEVYGWFTEGFDTKDLQEAKLLLDELAP
jgi:predicted ATPase